MVVLRAGLLGSGLAASAVADVQVLVNESFEVGSTAQWSRVVGGNSSCYFVLKSNGSFTGSNIDGVSGDSFLLFGSGTDRGTIRFTFPTAAGREYRLTYNSGATDSWSQPQKSQTITFRSVIQAFHGMNTVINHLGQEVELEVLESLGSKTHVVTTPGVAFWRISGWERAEMTFRASSSETRIVVAQLQRRS